MEDLLTILYDASAWVVPLLIAITFHEAAHGFVAKLFGDPTAKIAGRMTLNPFKHIDPVGTVALPGLLIAGGSPVIFGFAKPVPVNFSLLSPQHIGQVCVAAAGPGINILLALISAVLLHVEAVVTPEQAPWLFMVLYRSLIANCVLAVFNLLPILPLDGGRVVHALLPSKNLRYYWEKTERGGLWVVIILLFLPLFFNADILGKYIKSGAGGMVEVILDITGHSERGGDLRNNGL